METALTAVRSALMVMAAALIFPAVPQAACLPTETNIEGPYYVPDAPFRQEIAPEGSGGEPLFLEGTVHAADCRTPLAGAVVELWQTGPDGRYDFSPKFLWRGRTKTDDQGRYFFHTVLPGRYGDGRSYRPAHLHMKISHREGRTLITQVYFENDPYLAADPFVKKSLVIPLDRFKEKGVPRYRGVFDIVLGRP